MSALRTELESARQELKVLARYVAILEAAIGIERQANGRVRLSGGFAARFSGKTCRSQVGAALEWKPGQTTKELEATLNEYGSPYSPGAITLALRQLVASGRARKVGKAGNNFRFALAESGQGNDGEAPSPWPASE